ncbi:MAG TPA: efflux RND transporter periplasmic adaptor subunit [Verrucomicrobiae bacterium]|nr:efflux RND transporter periplasmic adaptor subunit [Verrucomicrobiae bacterium]
MQVRTHACIMLAPLLAALAACSRPAAVRAGTDDEQESLVTVGVAPVERKPITRQLTVSSELVPFQEIDVYAKEAGYVKDLKVDYGTRVQKGQLMAVLEIPELEVLLQQDQASIQSATTQVVHAQHELDRLEAQHNVLHLQADRLSGVAKERPGLVAQQEIDDSQGKDLAAEAQVEAGKSAYETAKSQLEVAKAKDQHDRVLFEYAKITAPFSGVVTQRYANLGTLMQAGTSSSTQALPLVRLSQEDLFRLVIPVPESYVKYIRIGDPVQVRVPSLDRVLPGNVKRFSVDVTADTRTMHTEVDVPNPAGVLIPGLYAEAALSLEHKNSALVVPLQAVSQNGSQATIFLVDPNQTLQERNIALGLQTADDAEVLSGLNEGDRVVVSDRSGLKAGQHVKMQQVEALQFLGDKTP